MEMSSERAVPENYFCKYEIQLTKKEMYVFNVWAQDKDFEVDFELSSANKTMYISNL